jgi:hypothetical protein
MSRPAPALCPGTQVFKNPLFGMDDDELAEATAAAAAGELEEDEEGPGAAAAASVPETMPGLVPADSQAALQHTGDVYPGPLPRAAACAALPARGPTPLLLPAGSDVRRQEVLLPDWHVPAPGYSPPEYTSDRCQRAGRSRRLR